MNTPYVFKRCTGCGEWLVASNINFHKNKSNKYGLGSKCKKCRAEQQKQYYKENRDKILEQCKQYRENNKEYYVEYRKQYYENNKDKILERCKQHYDENRDKIAERHKQHYKENRDKILEQCKQYHEDNRDKISEYHKQYHEDNRDKISEYHKQHYKENRDKILEQRKQYYENNKDKELERCKQYRDTPQGQVVAFNKNHRRRLRKQNQGNGINTEQWKECMNYFNWECAYSGITLTKENRSIDHIKPLNQDGEHEIWNVVPMDRGLNSSKNNKDLLEWYKEQPFFSEERLQKIYEWQEYAFNKWGYETLEDNELE